MVPVDELKPSKHRSRKHSDKQKTMLAGSIRAFGMMKPLVIDRAGHIVAGHAMWDAAKMIGLKQVPCFRADHLSEDELRAYALADNKLAELSEWDEAGLRAELGHLISVDLPFEIEVTGFELAEIDIILDGSATANETVDPADMLPEPSNEPPTCRLSDLWHLGAHRLYCGSSLEATSFEVLLDGHMADSVHSDAPYNVAVNGHVSSTKKHPEFGTASGEMSQNEFIDFLATVMANMTGVLKDGAILALWMDWRHAFEIQTAARSNGLTQLNLCVWNKVTGGQGSLYRSQHELCFIFKYGRACHTNMVELGKHGRYRTNVWNHKGLSSFGRGRDQALSDHPTQKPVSLTADAIRDVTRRGDIILDPFLGSGTTLIAAHKVGRVCYGIELSPVYCDTIIRRYEKLTGEEAIHLGTGLTFAELRRQRRETAPAPAVVPPLATTGLPSTPLLMSPAVRHRARAALPEASHG
ncbi:Modification methylase DpnIIB [Aminobacter sp. MSH1]|nr:Modification methylase DpnIIB [Aminobacter sp. MSH1]